MNCIVGYKKIDYVNKDGRRVEGYKVYLLDDHDDGSPVPKGLVGSEVSEEWISSKVAGEHNYSPVIGDYVNFQYNKYGQLTSFTVNQ